MLKSTIGALSLAMFASCSLLPAKATVFVYGVRQNKVIFKSNDRTSSEADWEAKGSGRQLHLKCLKESFAGTKGHPECISRAAAVVDFTKEDPRGVPLTYFGFLYDKRQAGTFFKRNNRSNPQS